MEVMTEGKMEMMREGVMEVMMEVMRDNNYDNDNEFFI